MTCGMPIANKYRFFQDQVVARKREQGVSLTEVIYFDISMLDRPVQKTIEGTVLDEMGITNVCCRRHMLTHVE